MVNWWQSFHPEFANKSWPYHQRIRINSKTNYFEIDTWCNNNISAEGVCWRRYFTSIWEFTTEEDLIAFRLAWKND